MHDGSPANFGAPVHDWLDRPTPFAGSDVGFRWRAVRRLEAGESQAEVARSLQVAQFLVESILNKWFCHQEGQPSSPQSINICTGSLLDLKRTTSLVDKGSSACS
ncbi:hypothetical protein TNCV_4046991 [Trichonephila clavipes]|nr:hypothetical protein TNCV_4046991 [Trichonephila clavipes]